jgi:hypothetical protein
VSRARLVVAEDEWVDVEECVVRRTRKKGSMKARVGGVDVRVLEGLNDGVYVDAKETALGSGSGRNRRGFGGLLSGVEGRKND